MKIDKNEYFESGKFTLSPEIKEAIQNELNNINGVVTDIIVTSSTDKQGLTPNLQSQLKKIGFTPDNQGLSKARNQAIVSYLTSELGVNNTLITSQEKFEQGGTVDQSARFVSVDIYYLQTTYSQPEPKTTNVPVINKTYQLSKPVGTKHQHMKGIFIEPTKLGKVGLFTTRNYFCPAYEN